MPYVLPDNRRVQPDQAFVLAEIQYPPNWLRHSTEQDRAAIGISWENDPPPSEPNVDIDDLKFRLLHAVDVEAERVRQKYVTPGAGMAMTYQEKHAQARAVDALGETAANALTEAEREDQFPTLSASVGIEAATLWDCAQLVIQKYEQFADLSRVIERTRLQGKKSISDASDVQGVKSAYEAITWTV